MREVEGLAADLVPGPIVDDLGQRDRRRLAGSLGQALSKLADRPKPLRREGNVLAAAQNQVETARALGLRGPQVRDPGACRTLDRPVEQRQRRTVVAEAGVD